jgi:exopolysaccharide production protein ExoY
VFAACKQQLQTFQNDGETLTICEVGCASMQFVMHCTTILKLDLVSGDRSMRALNLASNVSNADWSRCRCGPRGGLRDMLTLRSNQLMALGLLVLSCPVFALVIWLIWRNDGAPGFYSHYRVGRDARLFKCLKFRTMYRDANALLDELLQHDEAALLEWQRDQKLQHDPRITPVGRFLRRTSLDELPQLINVLRGEMALIGPRPVTVAELSRYGGVRWHYFSVRPGITGLWQVSGRNNLSYQERVALDQRYIETRSLWVDFHILYKTVRVIFSREGAR